ncbi:hypothetical protein KY495_23860 [Massilia sp. PAMC28688]|uniref:hypothetical protein n=1 Tax=Massilia sp. PAMC28688 TaxID=2861283 RepID=UPI001C63019F|nr:hypothetical protein [Massilia sp. PAMC28688]QYF93649.1 hypothetical protein KY495_23860 [Massilia sp. PAMC28688]
MNESKSNQQNQQSGKVSEAEEAKREAGVTDKSSHDHMSREKAGKEGGAGGGAKQEQKH